MSIEQLAYEPDPPKPATTSKTPSVYISPWLVRDIFEGRVPFSAGGKVEEKADLSVILRRIHTST
jgi:hypothetical protein